MRKALLFLVLLFSVSLSMAEVPVPPLESRVTDLSGTLAPNEIAQLEQKLAAFEAKKGSQIAVLIVPTTHPETIEQYSIRVAEAWKLGRKGVDDGILLLVAKQDRTLRIEVGYGLEGVLPDATANRIVEEIIVPKLRQGNFAGGLDAGIEQIARVVEGEQLPPSRSGRGNLTPGGKNIILDNMLVIVIGLIAVAKILQSVFGRFIGASITGVSAGFIGWLVFSSIVMAIIAAMFIFFISLFGNAGGGILRGGRGGWPGGAFGGVSGRGGYGGGGFSGGGGGFGGGGASGRW